MKFILNVSRPTKSDSLYLEEEMEEDIEMLPRNPSIRRKPTLRKQMSIMEVPSDGSGIFKMTHWV